MNRRQDRAITRRGVIGGAASGAALVGTAGVAGAQATNIGEWMSDVSNYTGLKSYTGQESVEVTVGASGNGGNYAFAPAAIRVDPGTTIRWVWNGKGGVHNVVSNQTVDGNPTFRSGDPVEDAGTTYERTFDEPGVYEYLCRPHLPLGMKGVVVVGDIEVDEGVESADGGGLGWQPPGGPFGSVLFGVLAGTITLATLAVLVPELYRASQEGALQRAAGYEEPEEPEGPVEETVETPDEEPAREIGHDEFLPVGTATLVAIYFLIVLGMWIFVYFIEFLGNGPTVVG